MRGAPASDRRMLHRTGISRDRQSHRVVLVVGVNVGSGQRRRGIGVTVAEIPCVRRARGARVAAGKGCEDVAIRHADNRLSAEIKWISAGRRRRLRR